MIIKRVIVALVSFPFLSQAVSARLSSQGTTKVSHEETTRQLLKQLVLYGSGPFDFLLKECEGDCDSDESCERGLICWQRESGGHHVPGCEGGENENSRNDYCIIDPDLTIEQSSMPPSKNPSGLPSAAPSDQPSNEPTFSPSGPPLTRSPSVSASEMPTTTRSWAPSQLQSLLPSTSPIQQPLQSGGPSETSSVSASPSQQPVTAETFAFMQCKGETQNCCNGLDTICDLRVDEILYASVHNAMATWEGALEAGYRGLNMEVCNCNGEYKLCRGICDSAARNLTETFGNINQFLEVNPTETILITLNINNGADGEVDLDAIYSIFYGVGGLLEKLYIHETVTDPWPTLREVVAANTRLLLFHYNGRTCGNNDCAPGFHYWFDSASETGNSFSSVDGVQNNPASSCEVTRGSNASPFFAINSFVSPPSRSAAKTLNSLEIARTRLETCSSLNLFDDVNLIFADFWSEGELPQLAQEHNAALVSRR